MAGSIYWLLFTKHRSFRLVASCLLLASWPLFLVVAFVTNATGAGGALGSGILPWAGSCAIWVAYLNRSRRVRVTFEHAIRVDSPASQVVATRSAPINASNEPRQTLSVPSMSSNTPLTSPGWQSSFESARPSSANDDEDRWATAIAEFDSDARRAGLWAKSFAKADGNESQAKAAYLQERVQQLSAEAATREAAEASMRAQAAQTLRENVVQLRQAFISGRNMKPEEVAYLALASNTDQSLAGLSEWAKGETLLHLCARHGLQDEALVLLKNGANAMAANGNGQKPFSVAEPGTPLRSALMAAAGQPET